MKKLIGAAVVLIVLMISTAAWSEPGDSGPTRSHPMAPVPAAHVAEHSSMTEQMRVMGVDGRMTADPMWSDMRDPAHIAAEEHMQEGLDRMLAR
jgi:hypothetical protein